MAFTKEGMLRIIESYYGSFLGYLCQRLTNKALIVVSSPLCHPMQYSACFAVVTAEMGLEEVRQITGIARVVADALPEISITKSTERIAFVSPECSLEIRQDIEVGGLRILDLEDLDHWFTALVARGFEMAHLHQEISYV